MTQTERPSPADDEDHGERLTRNWNELLQELRVTQTGIQLLTGFLVTIPFTQRFGDLDGVQRTAYLVVLCGAVLTTAVILAPVAFHRILFRQREKDWLVETANRLARVGLVMVSLVTCGVLYLIFDVVLGEPASLIAALGALVVFGGLWLAVPGMVSHLHDD